MNSGPLLLWHIFHKNSGPQTFVADYLSNKFLKEFRYGVHVFRGHLSIVLSEYRLLRIRPVFVLCCPNLRAVDTVKQAGLGLLGWNDTIISQIRLVGDKHDLDRLVTVVKDLVEPVLLDVLVAALVVHTIQDHYANCVPIMHLRQLGKTLLTGRIPYLNFQLLAVVHYVFDGPLRAAACCQTARKLIFCIATNKRRLSHVRITEHQYFDEVVSRAGL